MVSDDISAAAMSDYSSMFRQYVARGVEHTLTQVSDDVRMDAEGREQALLTLTYALDVPEVWQMTRDLMVALAPRLEQAGYRESWIPLVEQGVEHCRQVGDLAGEGELRFQLGVLRQFLGSMEDAYAEYEASARCFAQAADRRNEAWALSRTANIRRLQRKSGEARQILSAADALLSPEHEKERGYIALVRGGLALDESDRPLAVQHYEESLALWERTGDKRQIAWGLTNLGPALRAVGRIEDAVLCYRRAIDLMEQIGDNVHIAAAHTNLGAIYLNTDQYDLALEYYLLAEQRFRQVSDHWRLAFVTTNLSLVYCRLGQLESAARYAEASIDLNRKIGDLPSVVNAMDCLAEAYLAGDRNAEAEAVLREAWALFEPIADEPGNQSLARDVLAHLDLAISRQAGR